MSISLKLRDLRYNSQLSLIISVVGAAPRILFILFSSAKLLLHLLDLLLYRALCRLSAE